jgi:hypothetical protein
MKTSYLILALAVLAPALAAVSPRAFGATDGDPVADAAAFRQHLIHETELVLKEAGKPAADPKWLNQLSYVPDANIVRALKASSVEDMLEAAKPGRLRSLMEATASAPVPGNMDADIAGRRLTIVIVPGVFAEFIKNRAFEDVLEKASPACNAFAELVKREKAKGNPNAVDHTLLVNDFESARKEDEQPGKPMDLNDLISMGELHVHGAKVRVILFNTPFASGESLGDNESRAKIMIRRLDKYLALTGGKDEPLAFVGYSRGTPLGLEMLSQAKAANEPWVANVRGMISLSGVVLGSSLADDATFNPESPTKVILDNVQSTVGSLEKYPEGVTPGWVWNSSIRRGNDAKWASVGTKLLPVVAKMNQGSPIDMVKNLAAVDPRAPLGIFLMMWKQLGLNNWNVDYNKNIDRFGHFLGQLVTAAHQLAGAERVKWFQTHELPKNVTYYAITAAMANPDAGEASGEKQLYDNPLAYGGDASGTHSYDDVMLIQNRKDYEKISGGIALNDSQVSVIQAAFPAGVIERLNPANQLHTKYLGITGTHHWGMALREVNKMKGGQVNGFPREALLRSLAITVLTDSK